MRRRTDATHHNYSPTLLRMVQFIEQEGKEKEQEIDSKSEEEYNIIKGNMLQTGRLKIIKQYDTKEIRCKQESQIERGKIMHMAQMQIVNNKLEIFGDIENDVRMQIEEDMNNYELRLNVLQSLIMEALFKLLENEVVIKCREIDVELIELMIPDIQEDYNEIANTTVLLRTDNTYLPSDNLPGVICKTPNNKISVNNTLDDRLKQVFKSSLPVMSQILFGTSRMIN